MKHFLAIICCMLMSAVSQAQSEQFSVKVMNADNEPVVGAHVFFPSVPANETFTDEEGVFTGRTSLGMLPFIVTHQDYQTYYGTFFSDSPQQEIVLSQAEPSTPQDGSTCFSFKVVNQNGSPVAGAHVIIWGHPELESFTDDNGVFSSKKDLQNIELVVYAPGYCTYYNDLFNTHQKDAVVLVDKVFYYQDQPATIVLPVAPDPAWGRYYSPNRYEYVGTYPDGESTIFFSRECSPQANIPYVIVPETDFELKVSDYDRKDCVPEDVQFLAFGSTMCYLRGSYFHRGFQFTENWSVWLVDKTLDCESRGYWGGVHIGPFRAYFLFDFSFSSTDVEMALVFEDIETGVAPNAMPMAESPTVFDLQGRRVQGQPRPGVYIRDGRKQVVR
ncbi:MAG: hypothetical protein J5552_08040 [Prevotella sp.]|nr:hypothetical protein [Prevotella sp.]